MEPLKTGVFHYLPVKHALKRISDKDFTIKVSEASLYQYWMAEAPGMILITAEYSRITGKYDDRGVRYAHIEAGHVAQNCFLQGQSLKLNIGIVGAFDDSKIIDLLNIPKSHEPILILPIGRSK
jgi:SagB-type dehydrogenase family enzyme